MCMFSYAWHADLLASMHVHGEGSNKSQPAGIPNQISKIHPHIPPPCWPNSSDSLQAYHWKQEPKNAHKGNQHSTHWLYQAQ